MGVPVILQLILRSKKKLNFILLLVCEHKVLYYFVPLFAKLHLRK